MLFICLLFYIFGIRKTIAEILSFYQITALQHIQGLKNLTSWKAPENLNLSTQGINLNFL